MGKNTGMKGAVSLSLCPQEVRFLHLCLLLSCFFSIRVVGFVVSREVYSARVSPPCVLFGYGGSVVVGLSGAVFSRLFFFLSFDVW